MPIDCLWLGRYACGRQPRPLTPCCYSSRAHRALLPHACMLRRSRAICSALLRQNVTPKYAGRTVRSPSTSAGDPQQSSSKRRRNPTCRQIGSIDFPLERGPGPVSTRAPHDCGKRNPTAAAAAATALLVLRPTSAAEAMRVQACPCSPSPCATDRVKPLNTPVNHTCPCAACPRTLSARLA